VQTVLEVLDRRGRLGEKERKDTKRKSWRDDH
jgi:hypothetical protein